MTNRKFIAVIVAPGLFVLFCAAAAFVSIVVSYNWRVENRVKEEIRTGKQPWTLAPTQSPNSTRPRTDGEIDYSAPLPWPDHHGDAWGNGYNDGYNIGGLYAGEGYPVPTEILLEALAERRAKVISLGISGREEWFKGFKSGFAQGYKDVTKKAF